VQSNHLGDFTQGQRPHRHRAVFEKSPLPVDDGLRYPQDGVEALLHVLDQPLGLL
jgi:hypothetical protein